MSAQNFGNDQATMPSSDNYNVVGNYNVPFHSRHKSISVESKNDLEPMQYTMNQTIDDAAMTVYVDSINNP